jgi:hypothetical protein
MALMEWRCNHQAFGRDVQPAITNSPTHLLTVIPSLDKTGDGKHCENNNNPTDNNNNNKLRYAACSANVTARQSHGAPRTHTHTHKQTNIHTRLKTKTRTQSTHTHKQSSGTTICHCLLGVEQHHGYTISIWHHHCYLPAVSRFARKGLLSRFNKNEHN